MSSHFSSGGFSAPACSLRQFRPELVTCHGYWVPKLATPEMNEVAVNGQSAIDELAAKRGYNKIEVIEPSGSGKTVKKKVKIVRTPAMIAVR